jgi:hypothetical protein
MKAFVTLLGVLVLAFGATSAMAVPNALLIEDVTPWNGSGISNAQTLSDIGYTYTQINSAALAGYTDAQLAAFDFISYASVQPMSYYANISANLSKIETYVGNGGTLIGHSCIWGWDGYDTYWNSGQYLPGGVGHNGADAGGQGYYSNSVRLINPSHPVANGWAGVVTEASLQNWNYSTHGWFTNLPVGYTTVIDVNDGYGNYMPCYVEYAYGSGVVRATMMTLEWNSGAYAGSRHIFRENEYYWAGGDVIPEPSTVMLLGIGLLGAGFYARKKVKK